MLLIYGIGSDSISLPSKIGTQVSAMMLGTLLTGVNASRYVVDTPRELECRINVVVSDVRRDGESLRFSLAVETRYSSGSTVIASISVKLLASVSPQSDDERRLLSSVKSPRDVVEKGVVGSAVSIALALAAHIAREMSLPIPMPQAATEIRGSRERGKGIGLSM